MIQSAMLFALGVFVSGLLWLALSVALVRRAQRLTERRLLASISTRRAEFETERDELRARHAVQMYRLEREVSRVLDMATAHRLEADVKEHDVVSLRAELAAKEDELQDLQARLAEERSLNQELERRSAEAGSALRSVQHALQLEISRRVAAETGDAGAAGQPRQTVATLRAENEALRAVLSDSIPGYDAGKLPRILMPAEPAPGAAAAPAAASAAPAEPASSGSVVPLPTRPRLVQTEPAEAPASPDSTDAARPAAAAVAADSSVAELVAHRMAGSAGESPAGDGSSGAENPETRFFEALAEIRALRRAASQAGE